MKRKLVLLFCVLTLGGAVFAVPVSAGEYCGPWEVRSTTTRCDPNRVCTIVGNPNPYIDEVTDHMVQTCYRDDGSTYQHTAEVKREGGCCR